MTNESNNQSPACGRSWEEVRTDFPVLEQMVNGHPLLYFDNAASSQKPRAVLQALQHFYESDNANVHRGQHELSARATDAYEGARARVGRYLNAADAGEIVFTRGATEAINLVANAWGGAHVRAGDVILLTELEHHSNLVPWQMLAQRTGAVLRFIPVRGSCGELTLERLEELLAGVRLFAFTHAANSMGTLLPAAELCAAARSRGVTTLVDGAQSAGHMPVDVQAIGCDFYAFSGHKMCGPTGIGALYGRAAVLADMPPWHGGGEMIETVRYESFTWKEAPYRFEAGTPPIAGAVALAAACDYLDGIGRSQLQAHDAVLTRHACEALRSIPGLHVLGPDGDRGALVSFTMEGIHPHDLVTYVNEQGLALRGGHHCNQPLMKKLGLPGTTRASFYFYNTLAEVDRMAMILDAARRYFA